MVKENEMPPEGHDIERYAELFEGIDKRVQLLFATQNIESFVCREARQVIEGAVALTEGKVVFQPVEFTRKTEEMERFAIDKIPCLAALGERDFGIRFYGIPSGYLFIALLEAILLVGRGETKLGFDTQSKLASVKTPLHLRVFVSPTCPASSKVLQFANQFAFSSDFVRSDMIDITSFPYLGTRYKVNGVPHVYINAESDPVIGLPSEDEFVQALLQAAQ